MFLYNCIVNYQIRDINSAQFNFTCLVVARDEHNASLISIEMAFKECGADYSDFILLNYAADYVDNHKLFEIIENVDFYEFELMRLARIVKEKTLQYNKR